MAAGAIDMRFGPLARFDEGVIKSRGKITRNLVVLRPRHEQGRQVSRNPGHRAERRAVDQPRKVRPPGGIRLQHRAARDHCAGGEAHEADAVGRDAPLARMLAHDLDCLDAVCNTVAAGCILIHLWNPFGLLFDNAVLEHERRDAALLELPGECVGLQIDRQRDERATRGEDDACSGGLAALGEIRGDRWRDNVEDDGAQGRIFDDPFLLRPPLGAGRDARPDVDGLLCARGRSDCHEQRAQRLVQSHLAVGSPFPKVHARDVRASIALASQLVESARSTESARSC